MAIKRKVLLLGLSSIDLKVIAKALDSSIHTDKCDDVLDALKKISKTKYDLLIVSHSIKSSEKTGLDFLKAGCTELGTLPPSILLINNGEEKYAVMGHMYGVVDYLVKEEMMQPIVSMTVSHILEKQKWMEISQSINLESEIKDPITQLFNKNYFDTRLKEEMVRSQRYEFPLSLLMIQIDEYDDLLEKYGPDAGEKLLSEMAQFMKQDLRSSDLLARLRRDQFAILLPHTSAEQVNVVWKRISDDVAQKAFSIGEVNIFVTLRAAIIPLNRHIEEIDSMLKKVEEKLLKNGYSEEPLVLQLSSII